jgi:hypothetical protein
MPPRFVYWTIIAGGLPTAFRATAREDLLPTFNRIQEKHPDAVMKYFARGTLWDSPEEAKRAADARRQRRSPSEARGRDWRPGGDHRDPRQPYKDAKKKRNLEWRKERFERRQRGGDEIPRERPHGDPLRAAAGKTTGRPWRPKGPPGARKSFGPAGARKPGGPPGSRKPGGPPRDRKPGGPPRDRRRRG